MKIARLSSMVVVLCLTASMALAQPRGERQGGGRGQGGNGMMMLMSDESPMKRFTDTIAKLDLTSDQKDKIEALKKEYDPKFKEVTEKAKGVLTDDQKKTIADGAKKIKEATGPDRRDAVRQVQQDLKLTDDQKTKLQDVGKEMRDLTQEARPKFMEVLTDEQKTKLRELMPQGGRGRGNRGGGNAAPAKEST